MALQIDTAGNGREEEDMKSNEPQINQRSCLRLPAGSALDCDVLEGRAARSLGACAQHSASSTLHAILPFIYSFLVSHFMGPYFQT